MSSAKHGPPKFNKPEQHPRSDWGTKCGEVPVHIHRSYNAFGDIHATFRELLFSGMVSKNQNTLQSHRCTCLA